MATGQEIREELAKWGLIQLPSGATGGATTYIIDTLRLKSVSLSAQAFDDCQVRVSLGTYDGVQTRVDYLDPDTGYLYVSPVIGGALAAADTYEIWRFGLDPDDVDRCRD